MPLDIDPIWTSSRTARQIYALGEVEKDISRLLSLAATSMSLLTLPQTDEPDDDLPEGGERSEQFVEKANEYFQTLDDIHIAIRSSLAHIRQSRIAPSAINAPPPGVVPPSLGVGIPTADGDPATGGRGLQEARIELQSWRDILTSLEQLKAAREREKAQKQQQSQTQSEVQSQLVQSPMQE
ncbi:hypothetical protein OBBRIDRAFT_731540 [Obba rivulosa]|uniref:Mediator of RNA polymerase II transcription subunit 11 n=1 Tax=Obba rivulosa TaxID=1052685 RepID=A0A8E2ASB0_9APHY|nr:hypothetical protein OBBRIDRAFT_731540 [Obba rivulosa]